MEADLLGLLQEIVAGINNVEESNFGKLVESDFTARMNEVNEETGIGVKGQLVLAGPTLEELKENGSNLYPDKSDDDMFAYISIKCKGDPQALIDEIQDMVESFGLPVDQLSEFGELKYHAGDGEVLIGFKLAPGQHSSTVSQFLVKPHVFGDGSEDITVDLSLNFATTFSEMLDDEPLFTHFLKGISAHMHSKIHEKTRENIVKVLAEKKDLLEPILNVIPFVVPLLLFKKADGHLELKCTDEMKETIKDSLSEHMPPALMSLKEIFVMVQSMGLPLDMFQPFLELIQNNVAGEISI